MSHRTNYWSCSKFADWLRGTPKGGAKTAQDWDLWRKTAKATHAVRYWLAETALDKIQDVVYSPFDALYSVKYYMVNRFVTRTHALTSTLPKGKWHEFEDRVLHCLFDELVNYVEIEEAWSNIAFETEEARKKYNAPKTALGVFRLRTWRSAEAGTDKLKWAAGLTLDDAAGNPTTTPSAQALAAREILELYNWWTVTRPNRVGPDELSGWSTVIGYGIRPVNDEVRDARRVAAALSTEIETRYANEDTEMLTRLVKVRTQMWT